MCALALIGVYALLGKLTKQLAYPFRNGHRGIYLFYLIVKRIREVTSTHSEMNALNRG